MKKQYTKTNLIRCPNCETNGEKQTLGRLTSDGNILIQRMSKSFHRGETIIFGEEFGLICGTCKEVVFKRVKS